MKSTSYKFVKTVLAGAVLSTAAGMANAAELSGDLVMINWLGGAQGEMMQKLEDDFVAKNPEVNFRNIVPQATGDARGGIRQVILGGEQADLLINTWPAFRRLHQGLGRPLASVPPGIGRCRLAAAGR